MVSKERLEQIARLEVEILTFPPNHAQVAEMAKELLAWRKAAEEPVVLTDSRNLRYLSLGRETALMWTKHNGEKGDIELFRKPDLTGGDEC